MRVKVHNHLDVQTVHSLAARFHDLSVFDHGNVRATRLRYLRGQTIECIDLRHPHLNIGMSVFHYTLMGGTKRVRVSKLVLGLGHSIRGLESLEAVQQTLQVLERTRDFIGEPNDTPEDMITRFLNDLATHENAFKDALTRKDDPSSSSLLERVLGEERRQWSVEHCLLGPSWFRHTS